MNQPPVLQVQSLRLSFTQYHGLFAKRQLQVIEDLSLTLHAGQLVAVVGASGSGKSLLAHALLGILPYNAQLGGQLLYKGEPLSPPRLRQLRGHEIVLVPQSVNALDPLMKVGPQLCPGKQTPQRRQKAQATLARYGLAPGTGQLYPFQLSGGMARRVLIGTAMLEHPALVIADEPTPGLHPQAAQRVLSHFREMADEGAAVLLITHDLELAAQTADRVVVFYAGTTLEQASAADFASPATLRHPYTKALWRAMPQNGFAAMEGLQPYAAEKLNGCLFAHSCPHAQPRCAGPIPYREQNGGFVRCVREDLP